MKFSSATASECLSALEPRMMTLFRSMEAVAGPAAIGEVRGCAQSVQDWDGPCATSAIHRSWSFSDVKVCGCQIHTGNGHIYRNHPHRSTTNDKI